MLYFIVMMQQALNCQTFQWLSQTLFSQVLTLATKEYKEETYDINRVARESIMSIQGDKYQEQAQLNSNRIMSNQIIHLCSLLGTAPKYFLDLLDSELINSFSHIITLNCRNDFVVERLFKDMQSFQKGVSLPDYMANDKIKKVVYSFINSVAKKIAKIYEGCSEMLQQDIKQLTNKIKNSKIMNNFLLYKFFREIAESSKREVIQKSTESVFRNCPFEVIEQFFNYIINKFEVIRLFANQEIGGSMFEPSAVIFMKNIQNNDNIYLMTKEAVSSQGRFAIFVKTYSEDRQVQRGLEDYLIVSDEQYNLRVINCKALRKKWYIIGDLKSKIKLTIMAKDYLIEGQMYINSIKTDKPQSIDQLLPSCQSLQVYTNFNGVVGRCLYMMKRYSGASQFFKDLSQRAILTKSMEQLMHQIPIIGYMILAGTFSANFYKILTNKFSTDQRKLKELGGFMINTTTTVGTSIFGAVAGQILIPVPILGAFIGGVIGGLIGDKGGKQINSIIQKKKFVEIVTYLKETQIDLKYWLCSKQFYTILGLKQAEFYNYLPKHMQDYVFATLIAFVVVCFHESKRLNEYNLNKATNIKQDHPGKQSKKLQQEFQEEIKRMNIEEDFETQFNLVAIIGFLEENNAPTYEHYEVLEKSILTFLSKII